MPMAEIGGGYFALDLTAQAFTSCIFTMYSKN